MAACQASQLRSCSGAQFQMPGTSPRRLLQPASVQAVQGQRDAKSPAPARVPAGWLWDKKAADTHKRLQEQNMRPKKSLGQNFMLDDAVLADIVAVAGVHPGDLVLEIGPGTGNLTRHLLAAGALVTAVEKDSALSDQLEADFAGVPALRLVCGDILRQDLQQLLDGMQQHRQAWLGAGRGACEVAATASAIGAKVGLPEDASAERTQDVQQPAATAAQLRDAQQLQAAEQYQQQYQQQYHKVKVVANLPYYITKDCLVQALPLGDRVSDIYFMLQDEVGVRLTQQEPGAADWRAMNLLTQYHSHTQYLFHIDRRKYLPVPKVHSAVVRFELIPPEQRLAVPSEAEFLKLIKKAFSQRRKVMHNALRPLYKPADVVVALEAVGLNPETRAQDLTLEQFGQLAWQLQRGGGDSGEEHAQAQHRHGVVSEEETN